GKNRVLTPHPGELGRLTGKTADAINADRTAAARKAAKEWGAIVVLKGARTVVAHPDGRTSEDPHEVPALASGGTGDVLSGIIGGLIAQGSEPFVAAVTGVYVPAAARRRWPTLPSKEEQPGLPWQLSRRRRRSADSSTRNRSSSWEAFRRHRPELPPLQAAASRCPAASWPRRSPVPRRRCPCT